MADCRFQGNPHSDMKGSTIDRSMIGRYVEPDVTGRVEAQSRHIETYRVASGVGGREGRKVGKSMRRTVDLFLAGVVFLLSSTTVLGQAGTCAGLSLGQLASLNGFVPFPSNSLWNQDISQSPVDPNSDNLINYIGADVSLHPDFGAGQYDGQSMGIPYQVEANSQAKVKVTAGTYSSESDPGPMPIPSNALIEGYPNPGNGDRHVLVLQRGGCWLYELYNAHESKAENRALTASQLGQWTADSSAIWDMTIAEQRPFTWTSADAAGLPIFTGLVRHDEVAAGAINHALRFTVPVTRQAFTPPASHWASSVTDPDAPPMGMRMRLKADFDISGFSASNQVILTALKKYGIILADNGSAIFITGTPDNRWNNDDLGELKTITASSFEVVLIDPLYTPDNVPTGPSPAIARLTASPSCVEPGTVVTLAWNVSNAIYNVVSPQVGPVRGSSVVVIPTATTVYTLYSTNQYGRATAKVKVTVQPKTNP